MITYRRKLCRIGELWFDEKPGDERVDVLRYLQRPSPPRGVPCEEFCSLVIDLSKDLDTLLAAMKPDDRYKLRRAEKDGLACEHCSVSDRAVLQEFCDFSDEFASLKKLPRINRQRLQRYADCGALELTRVRAADGSSLVWHSYFRGGRRVRGLHSASLYRQFTDSGYRNLIGRANRYLIWRDMVAFRSQGIVAYDLGGWYPGNIDVDKLRINQFKESFGGQLVREFNAECGVTRRGRLLLWLRDTWRRTGTTGGEDGAQPRLGGASA